jgi:hypothetical protein
MKCVLAPQALLVNILIWINNGIKSYKVNVNFSSKYNRNT